MRWDTTAPGIASEDIERWMYEGSRLQSEHLAALFLRDAAVQAPPG